MARSVGLDPRLGPHLQNSTTVHSAVFGHEGLGDLNETRYLVVNGVDIQVFHEKARWLA